MKKNIILSIFIVALVVIIGFLFYNNKNNMDYYYPVNEISGRQGNIIYASANYIADFEDIRKVAGFADNIFVGEVVEDLGKASAIGGSVFPNTNFKVKVIYNIKGGLKGDIVVRQEGGYAEDGTIHILDNNELLSEGEVYLLVTRGDTFTILSHPNGLQPLFTDNQKSITEIKDLINSNKIVDDYKGAYKNELNYEGNFKISSEINAYKSLTKEQKVSLENINYGYVDFKEVE